MKRFSIIRSSAGRDMSEILCDDNTPTSPCHSITSQLSLDAGTDEDSNKHSRDLLLSKEDEASAAGEADVRHTFPAHEFRC